jgi:hypothetical protein
MSLLLLALKNNQPGDFPKFVPSVILTFHNFPYFKQDEEDTCVEC